MQDKKVLIVEDELLTRQLVARTFKREGAHVIMAGDGQEAMRLFYDERPDLVVIDIVLPKSDGWEVSRQIKRLAHTPIIFLTAVNDENSIIRGLDLGAADYITKPFSPKVLLARARAALRNPIEEETRSETDAYKDRRLQIDLKNRRLIVDNQHVKLTKTEFDLLAYLVINKGRVLTFDQILSQVWGPGYGGTFEYIHVYVSRLRQKFEINPRDPQYIHSEHGIGYRFEGPGP